MSITAGEVPPLEKLAPSAGFVTTIEIWPGTAICEAETVVVSCVELTRVDGCTTPLKSSVTPCAKFTPLMVRRNDGDPATTLEELIEEIVGDA